MYTASIQSDFYSILQQFSLINIESIEKIVTTKSDIILYQYRKKRKLFGKMYISKHTIMKLGFKVDTLKKSNKNLDPFQYIVCKYDV